MNIFFLHLLPLICAQMHVDKHVVKMILETAQLLCSAHHMTDSEYTPPYKLTHKNHPCAVWTRTSLNNYKWLCKLGIELCKEYTFRYGKTHKCEAYIRDLTANIPPIPRLGFTPPAQAMPEEYKNPDDVVDAYRQYYFFEKFPLHSWSKRSTPEWVSEITDLVIL